MGLGLLDELKITDAQLASFPRQELLALNARAGWLTLARPNQRPTYEHDWRIWVKQAGRGEGKTRLGAEWCWWESWYDPGTITHVVARRDSDHLNVTFAGESGLLSVIPYELIKRELRSPWTIELTNGSVIKGFTAAEPNVLRGPQSHRSWLDELAGWERQVDAFRQVEFSTRLRSARSPVSRILITTTPKPSPIINELVKSAKEEHDAQLRENRRAAKDGREPRTLPRSIVIMRGSTWDNIANLDPATVTKLRAQYEGTRLGRQELEGELIDPEEAGIVKRSSIRLWPSDKPLPHLDYVVMSLDTAFTEHTRDKDRDSETYGEPDPTACEVWGLFKHLEDDGELLDCALLLDAWQDWIAFPALIERVKDEREIGYGPAPAPLIKPLIGPPLLRDQSGRRPDLILIEDKGSGISLRQMLDRERVATHAFNPGKASKLTRLHTVAHAFVHQRVWVCESEHNRGKPKSWAEPAIEQWCTFSGEGSISHDDHVDAMTQAMILLISREMISITEPPKPVRADHQVEGAHAENPYAV